MDFVERERTPRRLIELGIRLHLAGLSLSNTVEELEKFGVQRSRKAVHDWVHKANLQPASGASPTQVAVDETVIRINGLQYLLYAAANPETNELLHVRLFSTTTSALTEICFRGLQPKHDIDDALFLVDDATHLKAALREQDSDFRLNATEIGTLSNVSFVMGNDKHPRSQNLSAMSNRTLQKNWLRAFAVWWSSLN